MNKEEKSRLWKGILLGSVITPICKHLIYPINMIVIFIALSVLIVWIIKDRKKSNRYNFLGIVSLFIGGVFGLLMGMKKLNDLSLRVQMMACLGPGFLGIILMGVGNHIKDPENVSKKSIMIFSGVFTLLLIVVWTLFSFGSRNV